MDGIHDFPRIRVFCLGAFSGRVRCLLQLCGPEIFRATSDRPLQCFSAYRFEQIVDAARLESLYGIGVIGGCHDDFGCDIPLAEYLEAVPVRKFDIHEYDVRVAVQAQEIQRAGNRICLSDHLHFGKIRFYHSDQPGSRHLFIFYYERFHINGNFTV